MENLNVLRITGVTYDTPMTNGITLNPKQSYALDLFEDPNGPRHILYGGYASGGKSFALGFAALRMCLKYPGTRWLLGRKELKTLKETTLVTFLDVCKMMGVIQGHHFKINWQDSFIEFFNGSRILLKDLKYEPSDPEFSTLGSLELTGALIDECNELVYKCFEVLTVRVGRYKNKEYGIPGKILMSCNPYKNWVKRTFYDPWVSDCQHPRKAFIPASPGDNEDNLDPDYMVSLRSLTGVARERLLLGNWDYADGAFQLCTSEKINELFTNSFVEATEGNYLTCDIAHEGSDMFTVWVWKGWRVVHIEALEKSEAKLVLKTIGDLAKEHHVPRSNIIYDSDGLGNYIGSFLDGAIAFHNGGKPVERPQGSEEVKEKYKNLKTQCAYELAKKINAGEIYISNTTYRDTICEEISWLRRDKVDDDNVTWLLSKKDVKLGLGRSPDYSDAMLMRMWFKLDQEQDKVPSSQSTNDAILGQGEAFANDGYGITDHY